MNNVYGKNRSVKKREQNSQRFQRGLDIGELEEDGCIRDFLVVEQHAYTPNKRREANVLDAGQVVQHDFGFWLGSHVDAMILRGSDFDMAIQQFTCLLIHCQVRERLIADCRCLISTRKHCLVQ